VIGTIKHDDPQIQEIFKRLNTTFYALSIIEKLSIEYAASEYMLFSKYLIREVSFEENEEEFILPIQKNPYIPKQFISWAENNHVKYFDKLILEGKIFTPYEISRQTHLLFTLNVVTTVMFDYFNRNDLTNKYLDKYVESFKEKELIFNKLENIAKKVIKIKFPSKSYWLNKANIFSLIVVFYKNYDELMDINEKEVKSRLEEFESNLPEEYRISAKEGVNNKKERLTRASFLKDILINI